MASGCKPESNPEKSLRERAEAEWRRRRPLTPTASEDVTALLHQLEVHQIEREMQNEGLRRAHQELEESRDQLCDLYDYAPVGSLTLSQDKVIVQANLRVAVISENQICLRLLGFLLASQPGVTQCYVAKIAS